MQKKYKTSANERYKDEIGKTYGRLTVLGFLNETVSARYLNCQCLCLCGKEKTSLLIYLQRGNTSSCGCLKKELISTIFKTHGMCGHLVYMCWRLMKRRCSNPKDSGYKYYGGKGIKVCDEWLHDFQAFYTWSMENGWKPGLEIERKKNHLNYCPENCRWATIKEQANNKTSNIVIEFKEETMTLAQAVEKYGKASYRTIHRRYMEDGWNLEEALLTTPLPQGKKRGGNH